MATRPVLISACLLGLNTRYDGSSKADPRVLDLLRNPNILPIPVCPEQLAGLPTPRPACSFAIGDGATILAGQGLLLDQNGTDVNAVFVRGAQAAAQIARLTRCQHAILKERSPSCGVHQILRQGETVSGMGVTAARLKQLGLHLRSEETLSQGSPCAHQPF
ncbi:MAG: 2-thiouracil desulfurase family protein [Trichloromonadaceae bacterium]